MMSQVVRPEVDGNREETLSTETLKINGFNFSISPALSYQVSLICKKLWFDAKIEKSGYY